MSTLFANDLSISDKDATIAPSSSNSFGSIQIDSIGDYSLSLESIPTDATPPQDSILSELNRFRSQALADFGKDPAEELDRKRKEKETENILSVLKYSEGIATPKDEERVAKLLGSDFVALTKNLPVAQKNKETAYSYFSSIGGGSASSGAVDFLSKSNLLDSNIVDIPDAFAELKRQNEGLMKLEREAYENSKAVERVFPSLLEKLYENPNQSTSELLKNEGIKDPMQWEFLLSALGEYSDGRKSVDRAREFMAQYEKETSFDKNDPYTLGYKLTGLRNADPLAFSLVINEYKKEVDLLQEDAIPALSTFANTLQQMTQSAWDEVGDVARATIAGSSGEVPGMPNVYSSAFGFDGASQLSSIYESTHRKQTRDPKIVSEIIRINSELQQAPDSASWGRSVLDGLASQVAQTAFYLGTRGYGTVSAVANDRQQELLASGSGELEALFRGYTAGITEGAVEKIGGESFGQALRWAGGKIPAFNKFGSYVTGQLDSVRNTIWANAGMRFGAYSLASGGTEYLEEFLQPALQMPIDAIIAGVSGSDNGMTVGDVFDEWSQLADPTLAAQMIIFGGICGSVQLPQFQKDAFAVKASPSMIQSLTNCSEADAQRVAAIVNPAEKLSELQNLFSNAPERTAEEALAHLRTSVTSDTSALQSFIAMDSYRNMVDSFELPEVSFEENGDITLTFKEKDENGNIISDSVTHSPAVAKEVFSGLLNEKILQQVIDDQTTMARDNLISALTKREDIELESTKEMVTMESVRKLAKQAQLHLAENPSTSLDSQAKVLGTKLTFRQILAEEEKLKQRIENEQRQNPNATEENTATAASWHAMTNGKFLIRYANGEVSPMELLEEFIETNFQKDLSSGERSLQWYHNNLRELQKWMKQNDFMSAKDSFVNDSETANETDVREAISRLVKSDFLSKAHTLRNIPKWLLDFVNLLRSWLHTASSIIRLGDGMQVVTEQKKAGMLDKKLNISEDFIENIHSLTNRIGELWLNEGELASATAKIEAEVSASVQEDNLPERVELNVADFKNEHSQAYLRKVFENHGWTAEEANAKIDELKSLCAIFEELSQGNFTQEEWNKKVVEYQETMPDSGIFVPRIDIFVKNGDYEFNIDLGTLCTKRESFDALMAILADKKLVHKVGPLEIERLKDCLKRAGFMTACDICFVEAKRSRLVADAQKIANYWQSVRLAIGLTDNTPIPVGSEKGGRELTDEQKAKLKRLAGEDMKHLSSEEKKAEMQKAYEELIPKGRQRVAEEDDGVSSNAVVAISNLFLKEPDLAGYLDFSRLTNSRDVDALLNRYYGSTNIWNVLSGIFGTATAKPLNSFRVYSHTAWFNKFDKVGFGRHSQDIANNGLGAKEPRFFTNMAGGRLQSFTDFNPMLAFDYIQMVMDFAARRLPLHCYTKVPALIKIFGACGIKINMSLIAAIDTRQYSPEEITLEGEAREALLSRMSKVWVDPVSGETIRDEAKGMKKKGYVVRYESPAGLRLNLNTNQLEYLWSGDSFPVQEAFSLRKRPEFNGNVGTIAVALSHEHLQMLLDDPQIDMVIPYHASGLSPMIKDKTGLNLAFDYTDYQTSKPKVKGEKVEQFNFNNSLQDTKDPKATVAEYLKHCEEYNLTPKFKIDDKWDFSKHPNYYKVLEDFRLYDNEGNFSPQKPLIFKLTDNWSEEAKSAISERNALQSAFDSLKDNSSLMRDVKEVLRYQNVNSNVRNLMMGRLKNALGNNNVVCLRQNKFLEKLEELYAESEGADLASNKIHEFRTADLVVYGFAYKGVIYLNEGTFNAHTPAHEFAHVWAKVIQSQNPKLWEEGLKLLKKSDEWNLVKEDANYAHLANDNEIASEVLARIVGELNEQKVAEWMSPNNPKPLKEKGLLKKIEAWLSKFVECLRNTFGSDIKHLTFVEFAQMPLADLWSATRGKAFNEQLKKHLISNKKTQKLISENVELDSSSGFSVRQIAPKLNLLSATSNLKVAMELSKHIEKDISTWSKYDGRSGDSKFMVDLGKNISLLKSIYHLLPKKYGVKLKHYVDRIQILAEMAATGTIDETKLVNQSFARKTRVGAKEAIKSQSEELAQQAEEIALTEAELNGKSKATKARIKELLKVSETDARQLWAEGKLNQLMADLFSEASEKLNEFAKASVAEEIRDVLDKVLNVKIKGNRKQKKGSVSIEVFNHLKNNILPLLEMTADAKHSLIQSLETQINELNAKETLADEEQSKAQELLNQMIDAQTFGCLDAMNADEAMVALTKLKNFVKNGKTAWKQRQEAENHRLEAMSRKIIAHYEVFGTPNNPNTRRQSKHESKGIKAWKSIPDFLESLDLLLTRLESTPALREWLMSVRTRLNDANFNISASKRLRANRVKAVRDEILTKEKLKELGFKNQKSWTLWFKRTQKTGISINAQKEEKVTMPIVEVERLLSMTQSELKDYVESRWEAGEKYYSLNLIRALFEEYDNLQMAQEERVEAGKTPLKRANVTASVLTRDESASIDNLEVSRDNALYIILLSEQPHYQDLLVKKGYTPEVIKQLKSFVGEEGLAIGYALREELKSQGDIVSRKYESIMGVPFPREENYYPARFTLNEQTQEVNLADLIDGVPTTKGASSGWQKKRVKHDRDLDTSVSALSVFWEATDITDHWVYTVDLTSELNSMFKKRSLADTLAVNIGGDDFNRLKQWASLLERAGATQNTRLGAVERLRSAIQNSASLSILAFRLETLIKQLSAILNGWIGDPTVSLAEFIVTMSKLKNNKTDMSFVKMIKSQTFKNRLNRPLDIAMIDKLPDDATCSNAMDLLNAGMGSIEWIDAITNALGSTAIYNIHYNRALKAGVSKLTADHMAWDAVSSALRAAQPIDFTSKSFGSHFKGPFGTAFFYMMSESFNKSAIIYGHFRSVFDSNLSAKERFRHLSRGSQVWFAYGVLSALIGSLLDYIKDDEDEWEDRDLAGYVYAALAGPVAGMPIIGELVEEGLKQLLGIKVYTGSAGRAFIDFKSGFSGVSNLWELIANESDDWEKYTKETLKIARLMGPAGGIVSASGNGAAQTVGQWLTALSAMLNPVKTTSDIIW